MTAVVVDASVAVAWFAAEEQSARAQLLQESGAALIAPSLLLAEIANALLMKARRGSVPAGHAHDVLSDLRHNPMLGIFEMATLIAPACVMAERLSQPVYDCLYLALAQREQAMLATFDRRMTSLAQRLAIPLWEPAA